MQALFDHAEVGALKTVVVYDWVSLAPTLRECVEIVSKLKKYGVSVTAARDPYGPDPYVIMHEEERARRSAKRRAVREQAKLPQDLAGSKSRDALH